MGSDAEAHYEFHDGCSASRQIINDPVANTKFTTEFLKIENGWSV